MQFQRKNMGGIVPLGRSPFAGPAVAPGVAASLVALGLRGLLCSHGQGRAAQTERLNGCWRTTAFRQFLQGGWQPLPDVGLRAGPQKAVRARAFCA